jgi:4-amino-4-deoxy-L-arabinose transferase-like glycosyltransferase
MNNRWYLNYNTLFLFSVLIFLFLQLYGLTQFPRVWEDETWYANVAHNFSIGKGFVNTNVGTNGGDDLFFYTFILGVFYKLFGTSLFISRLISVIIGVFTIFGFYKIFKYIKLRFVETIILSLLIIFSSLYYIIFRTVRPEAIVLFLTVWSIYFLLKTIDMYKAKYNFLIGLFSGLAFLSHPDGGLMGLVFGLYFLYESISQKSIKHLVSYALGTLPAFLALFTNIIFFRDEGVVAFFDGWLTRSSFEQESSFIANRITIIKKFVSRYTLGIKRMYILIFEFAIMIVGVFFSRKNKKIFVLSILGLSIFVFSFILLSRLSTREFGLVTVFSFVILGNILYEVKSRKKVYILILMLSAIYFFNNLAGDVYFISTNSKNTSYSHLEREIDKYVENDTKVLSLLSLWFPLKENENYNYFTRWSKTKYKSFNNFLKSGETEYVVISDIFISSETQTSGRKVSQEKHSAKSKHYFMLRSYAMSNGTLIHSIPTNGFGTVEIWKCNTYEPYTQEELIE